MPNKPILFSGPMVRAIIDGQKTMTRRVLKPQPDPNAPIAEAHLVDDVWCWINGFDGSIWSKAEGVKHAVGDLLWVRETWRPLEGYSNWDLRIKYAVDGSETHFGDGDYNSDWNWPEAAKNGNVPSIFMPKWASRITLKVTSVKVERLQDISEEDAIAEGCRPFFDSVNTETFQQPNGGTMEMEPLRGPVYAFQHLWDSLNAKRNAGQYAWDQNPWVSVTIFEPIFKNINEIGETE